jgi:hypothetical protein
VTRPDHPTSPARFRLPRRSRRHLAIAVTATLLAVAGGGASYLVGAEVMHGVDPAQASVR